MRILVAANTLIGHSFWTEFAHFAKGVDSAHVSVLCSDESQVREYSSTPDAFDGVLQCDLTVADHDGELEIQNLIEFGQKFEIETGALITDLLQSDRGLGRGYIFGGINHPEAYSAKIANYWRSLEYIKNLTDYFDDVFSSSRPDVFLLGGVASLIWKTACIRARFLDIPVRILFPARYENRWLWAYNEFMECPPIESTFKELSGHEPECELLRSKISKLDSYATEVRYRNEFAKSLTLLGTVKKCLIRTSIVFEQLAVRRLRNHPPATNRYPLRNMIGYYRSAYRQAREYRRSCISDAESLAGISYAYLPLSVEPEATLSVTSPEFNNQLALIDFVAKALPCGTMLAVKEHIPAVGRRPRDFYKWLAEIPNVILLPLHANGAALARGSQIVITIAGTVGLEAAVAGIPVFAWSRHNIYNVVPHVTVCPVLSNLRDELSRAIDASVEDLPRRKVDGSRLLRSIEKESVDLGSFNPRKQAILPQNIIRRLYMNMAASLDAHVQANI